MKMGWLYTNRQKGISNFDFFSKRFNYENENGYCKLLKACTKKYREVYCLFEVFNAKSNTVTRFIVVCLTQWHPKSYYNFGYKEIEETMGPYQMDCPVSYINECTEPMNEYSAKWREAIIAKDIEKKENKARIKKYNEYLQANYVN